MPRDKRPSKFSTASVAPQISGGGGSSGAVRAKYDFQEGTPNEGSPTLVGFEDARPGWVRFLAGLGGVQGPDVSGMNAQLALAREGTTAQREMQTEKLRAELEQMRERAKHDLALEEIRNKYRLGQIGAEQAAVLMNNLATNYAQHKGRMAELTAGGEQNRMTQAQKAKLDKENEEFKTYLGWAAKTGANPNDPESMKIYTELQRQVGSTALRRAKSFEGDKQLDDAAKLGELGSLLAPHAKAQKDYTTVVNEKDAAMFGAPAGSGMPRGMLFGATPGTPARLNTPGTPPSPARFEATPDMAAMRAGALRQEPVMLNPKWLQPSAPQPKVSTAVAEPRPELQIDYNPGVPSATDVAKLLRIWPFVQQQAAKQEVSTAVPAQREPVGDGTGLFGPAWRAFKQAF